MPVELISGNHQIKVDHTPTVDVTAGTVVLFGSTLTITSVDIPANTLGAVNWPNGGAQYSVPNTDGLAFAAGAEVFMDITNGKGLASGGDGKIGVVTTAVAATDDVIPFIHER